MRDDGKSFTFHTSLRCLSHPLTLTSLVLLLLNDHWLKQAMPSYLTGKLSDFAGLFFFPFLLSVLLGLAVARWQRHERRVAALSFGLTLAWFAAIKTLPAANLFTRHLAGLFTGGTAQIALDPSDLLALLSLLPAWLLWLSMERQPRLRPPSKLASIALGTAALATLATSPGLPRNYDRFVSIEGGLMLANGPMITTNRPEYLDENAFAYSPDAKTWQAYTDITSEIWESASIAPTLPKQVCRQLYPQECYRITGQPQVERSTDGGATWQVDWQFPEERLEYMSHQYLVTPPSNNTKPLDLAILELEDGPRVSAAMGDQGALLRLPDGRWERIPVLYATPTDLKASNILDALGALIIELAILTFLVLVSILILSVVIWVVVISVSSDTSRRVWAMHPLWLIAAGVLVAIAANWIIPSGDTAFNVIILILSCLLILTGMIWTWVRVARLSRRPVAVLGLTAISCLVPLAAGIAALFILILWAFWVIPNYTTAILLVLAVSGMILFVTIMATILLARLVVKKNNQPGSSPVDKPAAT